MRAFFVKKKLFYTIIYIIFAFQKQIIMDTKLTLSLDKYIVEDAKKYAASQNKSLSKIIESFLKSILDKNTDKKDEIIISPFVESMTSDLNIPIDFDYKAEKFNYLTEKNK